MRVEVCILLTDDGLKNVVYVFKPTKRASRQTARMLGHFVITRTPGPPKVISGDVGCSTKSRVRGSSAANFQIMSLISEGSLRNAGKPESLFSGTTLI
jgi:hypothetical protein